MSRAQEANKNGFYFGGLRVCVVDGGGWRVPRVSNDQHPRNSAFTSTSNKKVEFSSQPMKRVHSGGKNERKFMRFGITYSWYHFLSRYFAISCCAVPLNCCASFAIFSALSSNRFNLSPRSTINMCARLTSLEADVARVPSSWMLAFGPEINFATERFGFPLAVSPTVQFNELSN